MVAIVVASVVARAGDVPLATLCLDFVVAWCSKLLVVTPVVMDLSIQMEVVAIVDAIVVSIVVA